MNRSTWKTKYSLALLILLLFSAVYADDNTAQNLTASILGDIVPSLDDSNAAAKNQQIQQNQTQDAKTNQKLDTRNDDGRIPVGASLLGAVFDRPYTVRGVTYHRLKYVKQFYQEGIASWYGKDDHGKKTSSGERYNMFDLTAAHKQLPMGSLVRVDCMETGKSVVVRINDRGPYVAGRIIDLSYAAATALGLPGKGLTKVQITLINGQEEKDEEGNFAVQIASYTIKQNAEEVASAIPNGTVESAIINGTEYFRVKVTGFTKRDDAARFKQDNIQTYPGALIISE